MSKQENIIKIKNGFPNNSGNGILLVCQLIKGILKEGDFLILDKLNKIQIKEVENILSSTDSKDYSFVIPREFENITKWSNLYGTELKVENTN